MANILDEITLGLSEETLDLYEKAKAREVDIYSLDVYTLGLFCMMLHAEVEEREKRIAEKQRYLDELIDRGKS